MENLHLSPAAFAAPAALARYGEIIYRERPVHEGDPFSRKHPKMPRLNRAKLFAPFAALDGFDDRVRRKETAYEPRRELDLDEEWRLNAQLYRLHCLTATAPLARANRVRVAVEYYVPCDDPESDAYGVRGLYRLATGTVLRVDRVAQALVLRGDAGELTLPFADLYRVFVREQNAASDILMQGKAQLL